MKNMIKNFKEFDLFQNVLIIIPHGGIQCPSEIPLDSLSKYQKRLANDCVDWYTDYLYDFKNIMNNQQISNPISNIYLNVNRNPNELEDCVPDFYEKIPIYKSGQEPSKKIKQLIINKYFLPFHDKIKKSKKIFILDGHSTATGLKDLKGEKVKKDVR